MAIAHSGSAASFQRLLFPNGFSSDVMVLIMEAWKLLKIPDIVTNETPITALLRNKLLAIHDLKRVSFITLEDPVIDPNYGTEIGRNDLNFYPINHNRQSIFFTVECKRLHTPHGSSIGDYLKEGVMRFITNRYSKNSNCGAMLGYVMDDNTLLVFSSLCEKIEKMKKCLQIIPKNGLVTPSSLLSSYRFSADTRHMRLGEQFTLHHLLIPVKK